MTRLVARVPQRRLSTCSSLLSPDETTWNYAKIEGRDPNLSQLHVFPQQVRVSRFNNTSHVASFSEPGGRLPIHQKGPERMSERLSEHICHKHTHIYIYIHVYMPYVLPLPETMSDWCVWGSLGHASVNRLWKAVPPAESAEINAAVHFRGNKKQPETTNMSLILSLLVA